MVHQFAGSPVMIDISATKTVLARFIDEKCDNKIEPLDRFPTPTTGVALVTEILRALKDAGPVSHVGIGAPGPLDPPNMLGWRNFPLVQTLKDALGVPVKLENDANVGARGGPSVFDLTISTGIGEGLSRGDPFCRQVVKQYTDYFAVGLNNLYHTINTGHFVVGGGLTGWGVPYLDRIRERFRILVKDQAAKIPEIRLARLGAEAAVVGAAVLPLELQ